MMFFEHMERPTVYKSPMGAYGEHLFPVGNNLGETAIPCRIAIAIRKIRFL